jgi:hypothetical protein
MTGKTEKVVVPVVFTGSVEVEVLTAVPQERREALARKVALTRLPAMTTDKPEPDHKAREEYKAEFGLNDEATAARDWDGCRTAGVKGAWSSPNIAETDAGVQRLATKAGSAGLKPEDLDESVHDLASSIASDVNNDGVEAQVRYLVREMGVKDAEREIDKLITEKE